MLLSKNAHHSPRPIETVVITYKVVVAYSLVHRVSKKSGDTTVALRRARHVIVRLKIAHRVHLDG